MNAEMDSAQHGPRTPTGITLQLNLSAGDTAYCHLTVPALVAAHRGQVDEVVVVADTCPPQSTPLFHAQSRFPAAEFDSRVSRLLGICDAWVRDGIVDRVVTVEPGTAEVSRLNKRYADVPGTYSHDHWGHAFTAYFCGWESARTRYVVHADADIILHQSPGFEWARHAVRQLTDDPALVAASPRICPPDPAGRFVRTEEPGSGWLPSWRLEASAGGWRSDWVSTRLHLVDRERLEPLLPLRGRSAARHGWARMANALASGLFGMPAWHVPAARNRLGRVPAWLSHRLIPAYPLPPEVLLNDKLLRSGSRCLYLADSRCWYIHPDTKPPEFTRLLPFVLDAVSAGRTPLPQRGVSGLRYDDWRAAANAGGVSP